MINHFYFIIIGLSKQIHYLTWYIYLHIKWKS